MGSLGTRRESECISGTRWPLRRPSHRQKYSSRMAVRDIIGARSTSPRGGRDVASICAARTATPPPMEMPTQKTGVPAGREAQKVSCTRSRSRHRSSNWSM